MVPFLPFAARHALAIVIAVLVSFESFSKSVGSPPVELTLVGDWQIQVITTRNDGTKLTNTVEVPPSKWHAVTAERYDSLPMFNPATGGWMKGARLQAVQAQECSTSFLLDPASLVIRLGSGADAVALIKGRDYDADPDWGTFGRLAGGALKEGQPVFATYRHGLLRLDSIVLTADHHVELRVGETRPAAPAPPAMRAGEQRLANVWLPGVISRLTPQNLFPLQETAFPEPPTELPTPAERWLPLTLAKLRNGKPLRVLAWGDSVTDGRYLPGGQQERWQEQFVVQLKKRFPKAQIELITEAWGGRNTGSYLAEPPGSEHNYAEKVLARNPDLIVSEFVNDAGLNEAQVEQHYGKLLKDFQAIGAEWIILTPHYVRPDWMGLTQERDIDDDPRPYVAGLRQFAAKHGLALADASKRYGRLWRQGIPYSTLMLNAINHPNAQGMSLFADSLLALFPKEIAAAPTPATDQESLFISDRPELVLVSTQSWGELGWNVAAHAGDKAGEPLRIGERAFSKGLGHHAAGAITVLLDGAMSAFDAEVGIQPCAATGSAIFRVIVDGEPRFESSVVHSGDAPVTVHVPVRGAMELRLEASDAGDGISCDMANWANARLTKAANHAAESADQRVDIGRFGRVVTWNPGRNDGARADRIQEFHAEDLFLDRDLVADTDGRFVAPVASNQLACIGFQWLNRRALREVRLAFADTAQLPDTNAVRVEGWFGESAWQGKFEPLSGGLERNGNELVFHVAARADRGGLLQTQKLRWVFPATNSAPLVLRPQAYARTRWGVTNLVVHAATADKHKVAELAIIDGEFVPTPASTPVRWQTNSRLPLSVRYARLSPLKSDVTVLQFRLPGGALGVAVQDVLNHGYVYVPQHGLLVTTAASHLTIAELERKVASAKTILQEVRQMPDQTFTQAMAKTHHVAQSEGPVMLSLACDNAKFVVERDGCLRFNTSIVTDTDWAKNAGELRPEFGQGPAKLVARHLDGGWLPSPVTRFRNAGVTYAERVFVAPCDDAGTDPTRLNRPSICVAEYTLSNEQPTAAPARLALNFLISSRDKRPATVSKCPQGWLVASDPGPLALVLCATENGLTATVDGGTISFTGMLAPKGTARCEVFLRARDENLLSLPPVAKLRAAFESHWNAALAPAMQIETPDAILNNIIRSSQVRCLIAARNEENGQRIAAWIAATHYGPLESEAHSVIRAMTFFGHEDFARRSLDFFIHRYNAQGFLTTGYTTFGTAWHLWTVGEHYQIHHDQDWLCARAPELVRVGNWIIRQTDKTSQSAAESRPEFGLMPPGVVADWNAFAYHFTISAYYYAALRELGAMLSEIHDPRGATFTAHADALRENTLRAYHWTQARSPAVALRNGAWIPFYPSQVHSPGPLGDFFPGQDAGRSWCYDVEIGAHQLVPSGVIDANSSDVEPMLEHMEDVQFLADGWFDYPSMMNQADFFDLGGFSKVQPYYTRNAEIYAMRDEVKPFLRSYFNSLAAMLNPEVLTLWEHFNHSGAWDKTHETGYFLHQTRTMLLDERANELWLAPLVTNNWLKDGMSVAVTNAPTRFGRVSYRLTSHAEDGIIEARITPPERSAPKAIVVRLRHPEGKRLSEVTVNGHPHSDFDAQKETIHIIPDGTAPIAMRVRY